MKTLRNIRAGLLLVILAYRVLPLNGQNFNFRFHHLSQEQGLQSTQNAFLFQDAGGLLWISSLEDVYLFDGNRAIAAGDFWGDVWDGKVENVQSPFFESRDHTIWFTTYTDICCFDSCRRQFSSIKVVHPGGDTIQDNYRLIHLQADSLLWVAAGSGLYHYQLREGTSCLAVENFEGVRFAVDTTAAGEVERIFSSPWSSRNGFDVYSFAQGSLERRETFFDGKNPPHPPLVLSQVLFEHDSLLWLFSDQGLVEFNPYRPQDFQVYRIPGPEEVLPIRNGINFNDHSLLVAVSNQGLWLFDKGRRKFTKIWKHRPDDPFSLSSNDPKEIFRNPDGSIWISHYGEGLDFFHPGQLKFDSFFKEPSAWPENKSSSIWHLVEWKAGLILGGTLNRGLLKADWKNDEVVRPDIPGALSGALSVGRIDAIYKSEGYEMVWVVNARGIYGFSDSGLPHIIIFPENEERFLSVVQVGQAEMLVATNAGIKKIDYSEPEVRFERPAGLPPEFVADEVDFLFADAGGRLYLPFESRDLLIYDYENGDLKEVKKLALDARINHFFDDQKKNCIWLGTSRGLIRVDKSDFSVVHYDVAAGLPPLAVYGVLPDDRDHLWLSTKEGLLDFDPVAGSYYHYHMEEGLQSSEFSRFSALRTFDGRLWFGGPDGLNGFFPDSIKPYPHPPRVLIENLRVNDQPYEGDGCREGRPGLSLRYWQNTLSFDLYALCNYLPQYNRLQFRVRGYAEDWTEAENGRQVRLFRLPPGDYVLEVLAANANNVVGEIKTMAFQIRPPFWQTLWFRLLVIAFIGASIYAGVQLYIRRRLRLQKIEIDRQNALQAERNRIASELHDDLGSGLSVIRYLSEHARRRETDAGQRSQIERISQSARDLIEKMGDIIWAMNSENDQLDNLLYHLEDYAEDYLAGNELDCTFRLPERIPSVELSGERRRNILLTVKEVLHNVVKHAGAGRVQIDCVVNGRLLIRIRDDGQGIDLENIRRGGNGLKNMEKRMTAIGGEFHIFSDRGTVVELYVPLPPND